jgi:hypothetical protein
LMRLTEAVQHFIQRNHLDEAFELERKTLSVEVWAGVSFNF